MFTNISASVYIYIFQYGNQLKLIMMWIFLWVFFVYCFPVSVAFWRRSWDISSSQLWLISQETHRLVLIWKSFSSSKLHWKTLKPSPKKQKEACGAAWTRACFWCLDQCAALYECGSGANMGTAPKSPCSPVLFLEHFVVLVSAALLWESKVHHCLNKESSSHTNLSHGAPQGSVVGPKLVIHTYIIIPLFSENIAYTVFLFLGDSYIIPVCSHPACISAFTHKV